MTKEYFLDFRNTSMRTMLADDSQPTIFQRVSLPYGLYDEQGECAVYVESMYAPKTAECKNLWELQAFCRMQWGGQRFLSTDNGTVDEFWLEKVETQRINKWVWNLVPERPYFSEYGIWVSIESNKEGGNPLVKDFVFSTELALTANGWDLVAPQKAIIGAVKNAYHNMVGIELKQKRVVEFMNKTNQRDKKVWEALAAL